VGFSAVFMALRLGAAIQIAVDILKFSVRQVQLRYLDEDYTQVINRLEKGKPDEPVALEL